MKDLCQKIRAMFDGLRLDLQEIAQLADEDVCQDDLYRIAFPFPASGRYRRYITFMDDLTSLKALYRHRVTVIVEYFIGRIY